MLSVRQMRSVVVAVECQSRVNAVLLCLHSVRKGFKALHGLGDVYTL